MTAVHKVYGVYLNEISGRPAARMGSRAVEAERRW